MNQILYTGGKNKGNKLSDTQKIIIFFVIFIIIFAICLIGVGANLLSKVKTGDKNTVSPNVIENSTNTDTNTVPEPPAASDIKIKFASDSGGVKVTVTSDTALKTIKYWWDEEAETILEVSETQYETVIPSKQGTHTLNVEAIDENENIKEAKQIVIGDSEPELTLATDKISNYVIKAKDDTEIAKVVIVLNGEKQEIQVNSKEFEHKVAIPQGNSLIEVTVYNLNGLSVTKKAKITNYGG